MPSILVCPRQEEENKIKCVSSIFACEIQAAVMADAKATFARRLLASNNKPVFSPLSPSPFPPSFLRKQPLRASVLWCYPYPLSP
eukprot:scaffold8370_cov101-Isochrysis_galbana.AAC.5